MSTETTTTDPNEPENLREKVLLLDRSVLESQHRKLDSLLDRHHRLKSELASTERAIDDYLANQLYEIARRQIEFEQDRRQHKEQDPSQQPDCQ